MSKKAPQPPQDPSPDDIPPALERRLSHLESMITTLTTALTEGLSPRQAAPGRAIGEVRRPTVKELRARAQTDIQAAADSVSTNSSRDQGLSDVLRNYPEPRRQRKVRNMAPRKVYVLKDVKSGKAIRELQNLAASAVSIVVYLIGHSGATVPDLVAQLDLKRKTIENALSTLSKKGLIESKDRH